MNKDYAIEDNIYELYSASVEARNLLNEPKRKIKAESTTWANRNAKSLCDIALQVIALHFQDFSEYFNSDVFSERNKFILLQILPTNLPLELISKIIPDGIFWKRAYHDMWNYDYVDEGNCESWKNAFMQKYLQNYVECLYPNDVNYNEIEQLIENVRCYVFSLSIEQLLTFDIYENSEAEVKHVDLQLILPFLTNLENLNIKAGMKNTGLRFSETLFELTTGDCINIAESLRSLRNLKRIKISSCHLNKCKLQHILTSLESLPNLQSVNFSSSDVSDDGFIEMVDTLSNVVTLNKMVLVNNKIGARGVEYFSGILHDYKNLVYLDLRFNFILDSGAISLFDAAKNLTSLKVLILASCKISFLSVPSLCNLITTNQYIEEIDLSCNNLGHTAGEALSQALQQNNTLQQMNLKMNNIATEYDEVIFQKLTANRKLSRIQLKTNNVNLDKK